MQAGPGGVLRGRHGLDLWLQQLQREEGDAGSLEGQGSDKGERRSLFHHSPERWRYKRQRSGPTASGEWSPKAPRRRENRQGNYQGVSRLAQPRARPAARSLDGRIRAQGEDDNRRALLELKSG